MIIPKKYFYLFGIILVFFVFGVIFFLFYKGLLVVRFFPNKIDEVVQNSDSKILTKKEVKFFYFKEDRFDYELKKLVWFKEKSKNLKHLVNSWLSFLQEERVLKKKVCLQSVLFDKSDQQVFLSFDRILFEHDSAIYYKWNLIESLLKTIRCADIKISTINFLVDHKKMYDEHLDFSVPWPVCGFY